MKTLTVTVATFFLSALAFAGHHAPLPPSLMAAKSIYIENNSGQAKLADRCYDELSKWGRFKIVSDPKEADVIFQIGTHVRTYGYSGHSTTDSSGNSNTSLTEDSAGFTTISIVNPTGQVLWSDTRRWGNLFTGFRSATGEVINELRKRMDEQEKHTPNADVIQEHKVVVTTDGASRSKVPAEVPVAAHALASRTLL